MITAQTIILKVAESLDVQPAQLTCRLKTARVAEARHIAVYLIRKLRKLPFSTIGRLFNRHHSTILHSWEQVHALASRDDSFARKVAGLETELMQEIINCRCVKQCL